MYYFAYGSNLSRKQMLQRCPDSKPAFPATLPNYKLAFVGWSRQWRGGVATVIHSRGDRVRGGVYDITEQCLRRLDRYEGYPTDYARFKVIVFTELDEAVEAITYAKAGQVKEGQPSKDYLALMQEGYKDWGIF